MVTFKKDNHGLEAPAVLQGSALHLADVCRLYKIDVVVCLEALHHSRQVLPFDRVCLGPDHQHPCPGLRVCSFLCCRQSRYVAALQGLFLGIV